MEVSFRVSAVAHESVSAARRSAAHQNGTTVLKVIVEILAVRLCVGGRSAVDGIVVYIVVTAAQIAFVLISEVGGQRSRHIVRHRAASCCRITTVVHIHRHAAGVHQPCHRIGLCGGVTAFVRGKHVIPIEGDAGEIQRQRLLCAVQLVCPRI